MTSTSTSEASRQLWEAERRLWKALGRWTAEIAQGGIHADLAPPQYVLDAVAALVTLGEKGMSKPFPALCIECKWHKPTPHSAWTGECWHPLVISKDAWALANNNEGMPRGSSCFDERKKGWFASCGQTGKLWEPK